MAVRAHFGDLLTPGFREIFDGSFKEVPAVREKIFTSNTSEKDTEKDSSVFWFGLAQETAEGAPIDYEDPVQGYDTTYTHLKYSKGFKISLELYEDGLYNIMNKRPAALGRCMARTAENQAALVFVRAFNASYLGADSEELCSTSHDRSDGGTAQSNASSTGITLTEANIETARNAMRDQLDDKGQVINVNPNLLLIPIELEKEAHEIIDSERRSGTADNDLNFWKGRFQIVDWIYLTSATAWFLMDTTVKQLNWFWRRQPTMKSDELFDTEYAVYKSTMRLSRGWTDWRGVWGSQGDGASYSG